MNDSIILEARELAFLEQVRRENSKAWHLPDDLFADAVKAHLAGVSYARVRALLKEGGVAQADLPSKTGWSNFWQRFNPFLRLARRQAAVEGANATAAEARKSPAAFEEASLDLIRQLTFELLDSDRPDLKEVRAMVSLLLKYKDRELKGRLVEVAERRVVLAEQQAAAKCGTLNDTALSAEQCPVTGDQESATSVGTATEGPTPISSRPRSESLSGEVCANRFAAQEQSEADGQSEPDGHCDQRGASTFVHLLPPLFTVEQRSAVIGPSRTGNPSRTGEEAAA